MIVAVRESHNLILPSPYLSQYFQLGDANNVCKDRTNPTAYMSRSVLLCTITVASAVQPRSFHRPRSSPFFTSQQRISSLAPTMARPAPVDLVPTFDTCSSELQTEFEDADVMRPNVLECSYFLRELDQWPNPSKNKATYLQVGFHHSWSTNFDMTGIIRVTYLKSTPRNKAWLDAGAWRKWAGVTQP